MSGWRDSYGAKVRIQASVPDVSVVVDPTAMGVVMRNLIENSVRHAKREPLEIRIEAAQETSGRGGALSRQRPGIPG